MPIRRLRRAAAASVAGVLLTVGAGSQALAGSLEACDLLSASDVAAAVGAPFEEGQPGAAPPATDGCQFFTQGAPDIGDGQVDLAIIFDGKKKKAAKAFKRHRSEIPDAEAVTGVGTKAFVTTNQFEDVELWVLKGGLVIRLNGNVNLGPGTNVVTAAQLQQLAETVLSRV